MRVTFHSKISVEDLREIYLHIATYSPAAAEQFVRDLDDRLETLCRFPLMGKSRDELATGLFSFQSDQAVVFFIQDLEGIKIARILPSACDGRIGLHGRI